MPAPNNPHDPDPRTTPPRANRDLPEPRSNRGSQIAIAIVAILAIVVIFFWVSDDGANDVPQTTGTATEPLDAPADGTGTGAAGTADPTTDPVETDPVLTDPDVADPDVAPEPTQ